MIPSFKPGILSSNRIRAVVTSDKTPNPVNWSNVGIGNCGEDCGFPQTSYRDVTGFDGSITLKVEYDSTNWQLYYYKVALGNNYDDCSSTSFPVPGFIAIAPNGTLTVNAGGESIMFTADNTEINVTTTVTVKNQSDGDAVLDTFNLVNNC